MRMLILGIESSCDETAAALVEDGVKIHADRVASQLEIHARYGGVVPEVASRQHSLSIIPVIKEALQEAHAGWDDIDGIAVTNGPGLAGSLLVGVNTAKAIALARRKPLTGVNHLEGHIYANWLALPDNPPEFPVLCLIVSGGHSDIILMKGHGDYTLLGRTRDDAAGEAFDKAARILNLGYPGGPAIQRAAEGGKPSVALPHTWLNGTNDFSFSGVKTALIRLVEGGKITSAEDAAASFQETVAQVLATKTIAAALENEVNQILVAGGVAANKRLRELLIQKSPLPVLIPPLKFCTDNASMIASCGYFRFQAGKTDGMDMDVIPGLKLG